MELFGKVVTPRTRYRFNYPVEFEALPDYSAHRGGTVLVIRAGNEDECEPIWDTVDDCGGEQIMDVMFKVRAPDGWEGFAWHSELEPID